MKALTRFLVAALLLPVQLYRRVVSPLIPPRCRYYPTCSSYAVQAIRVHGPIRGPVLAAWRVVRCNPWSHGGVDRVPPRRRPRQARVDAAEMAGRMPHPML